jgi:mRNA-degrading endonuclease toxin of MazEF toxin-antitoxin module
MQVIIQRGQVWNAMVPYNESQGGKFRPSVIVGWSSFARNDDHNVLIVPSYTFGGDSSKALGGDMPLADPTLAGLTTASRIRCRRLMTLNPRVFDFSKGPLGTVSNNDLNMILTEVEKLFAAPQMATVPGFR